MFNADIPLGLHMLALVTLAGMLEIIIPGSGLLFYNLFTFLAPSAAASLVTEDQERDPQEGESLEMQHAWANLRNQVTAWLPLLTAYLFIRLIKSLSYPYFSISFDFTLF